tara:strand:+ start:333 stop:842 length:510 start_codon:yes stop_codon:yes gene_type:complete
VDNPYPRRPVEITEYNYHTPLHLVRAVNAPKYRRDRDAKFILARDFTVSWRDQNDYLHHVTAPEGMLTDLTSSPVHSVIAPTGPWLEAAIIHDFLYVAWEALDYEATDDDRLFADDMLLAGCEASGVGWFKRHAIYRAVRAGGWVPFSDRDGKSFLSPQELRSVLDAPH